MNETKVKTYLAAHSWLAKNAEIYSSDRFRALEIISKQCAEVMETERVGIWFFSENGDSILEELTVIKQDGSTSGSVLKREDFPVYFKKIKEEGVVLVRDTYDGPFSTKTFENYVVTKGVLAILDVPIFSDGLMIGIISIEKKASPRDWDELDISFATIFSDFVGRIIESEKRHSFEKDLHLKIENLETNLKKKMEDLAEANLSLNLALDSAQIGKWDWDITTNTVKLSRSWYTKLGYRPDEMPSSFETFKQSLHPDDVQQVIDQLTKFKSEKKSTFEHSFRMITKTGETQWCIDRGIVTSRNELGQPLKMIGLNVNITPLIKIEEAIVESEKQLKAMIRSLPTPVAMFDKKLNYLAYSSKWFEEWTPYTDLKEDLSVRNLLQTKWFSKMERVLQGETIGKDEELIEIVNGQKLWIRWAMKPWTDARGDIGGIIFMAENITHIKETQIHLAQNSKLSALGEMAGGIAHEINNPLSIIKGYVDLINRHNTRQTLNANNLEQYLNKIDQTVSRISKIVTGMKRFSRESSKDEKVRYPLNKIIEETLDICQEKMNNFGTKIEIQNNTVDLDVFCRPVEISQVLLNLINNSFYAISSTNQPWIKLKIFEDSKVVSIKVMDSGKSLSEEIKNKLFQPFFTTKEVGVGTGLGLSISKGIIEEHGGKLYYDDKESNTTFVIELPKY